MEARPASHPEPVLRGCLLGFELRPILRVATSVLRKLKQYEDPAFVYSRPQSPAPFSVLTRGSRGASESRPGRARRARRSAAAGDAVDGTACRTGTAGRRPS